MANELKQVLMDRDGLTEEEAEQEISDARDLVFDLGMDPSDVLLEEFGLEPDYIFDLISV